MVPIPGDIEIRVIIRENIYLAVGKPAKLYKADNGAIISFP
jgi:hypothetical protein